MSSRRLLKDTVILKNYIGEINDKATYQETVLTRCFCPCDIGVGNDSHGKNSNDTSRLYIFDFKTIAKSLDGKVRTYLPYRSWIKSESKDEYWTISDCGTDFFIKDGVEYKVVGFSHKNTGSKRMHHFEVDGK